MCAEQCPSTALEIMGREWTVDELVREVKKDKVYFDKSDGGVTLSGGEPSMQPVFTLSLLKALRAEGIQTALDTCGLCKRETLDSLMPYADLLLYDMKEIDPIKHEEFTGTGNKKIFDNLIHISAYLRTHIYPKHLWLRTPMIPSATAREDNVRGIGKFVAKHLGDVVDRWELCAFNNLCRDKYARLGISWSFKDSKLLKKSEMESLADIARDSGVQPDIVFWSGATEIEEPDITENADTTVPGVM